MTVNARTVLLDTGLQPSIGGQIARTICHHPQKIWLNQQHSTKHKLNCLQCKVVHQHMHFRPNCVIRQNCKKASALFFQNMPNELIKLEAKCHSRAKTHSFYTRRIQNALSIDEKIPFFALCTIEIRQWFYSTILCLSLMFTIILNRRNQVPFYFTRQLIT